MKYHQLNDSSNRNLLSSCSVLEARSPISRCRQGHALSDGAKEGSVPGLS